MNIAEKIPTKEALIESAAELFVEKGYAAVSTREIADRAGVNLGSIQYHFGSKANLFVETVTSMMRRRHELKNYFVQCQDISRKEDAAFELCVFVRSLLFDLCNPEGLDVCRLMHREIHGAPAQDPEMFEALVSSVVNDFISPRDSRLRSLVNILVPEADPFKVNIYIQAIIGQCSFYVTHRPFIERLRDVSVNSREYLEEVADTLLDFTMRGLGLEQALVSQVIAKSKEVKR